MSFHPGFFTSFLSSPIGGLISNFRRENKFQRKLDEFQEEQVDPFNRDVAAVARTGEQIALTGTTFGNKFFSQGATNRRFDTEFDPIRQGFAGFAGQTQQSTAELQRGFNDLNTRFGNRLSQARGLVNTLGEQERSDINLRFDARASSGRADLTARGIGGTTVRQSQAALIGRERGDELRRLQDQITKQRLGVEFDFGGEALRAREGGLTALNESRQFGINTRFDALGAQGDIAAGRFGAQETSAINRLGNQQNFGQFGIDTRFRALDQRILTQPGQPFQATLQAPVR